MSFENKFIMRDNVTDGLKKNLSSLSSWSAVSQVLVFVVYALLYIGDAIMSLKEKGERING